MEHNLYKVTHQINSRIFSEIWDPHTPLILKSTPDHVLEMTSIDEGNELCPFVRSVNTNGPVVLPTQDRTSFIFQLNAETAIRVTRIVQPDAAYKRSPQYAKEIGFFSGVGKQLCSFTTLHGSKIALARKNPVFLVEKEGTTIIVHPLLSQLFIKKKGEQSKRLSEPIKLDGAHLQTVTLIRGARWWRFAHYSKDSLADIPKSLGIFESFPFFDRHLTAILFIVFTLCSFFFLTSVITRPAPPLSIETPSEEKIIRFKVVPRAQEIPHTSTATTAPHLHRQTTSPKHQKASDSLSQAFSLPTQRKGVKMYSALSGSTDIASTTVLPPSHLQLQETNSLHTEDYIAPNVNHSISLGDSSMSIQAGLSPEEVGKVIHQHLQDIRYCHEAAHLHRAQLNGTLLVNFLIDKMGTTKKVSIQNSTVNDEFLENCIIKKFSHFQFKKPSGSVSVSVSYPLYFKTLGGL